MPDPAHAEGARLLDRHRVRAMERTRVLIAGGGVAGLEATLALKALAPQEVEIDVLAAEPHFWYRPLAVAEPFGVGKVHRFELSWLVEEAGATLVPGTLASVDTEARTVRTRAGEGLEYDALLLAIGAKPVEAIAGALTFRGPADTARLSAVLADLVEGHARSIVYVVPGGVSWPLPAYELALLTRTYVESHGAIGAQISIVTPEPEPLAVFGPAASAAMAELLDERNVEVCCQQYAEDFEAGLLELVPCGGLDVDVVVALPRLAGPAIQGVPSDRLGFVPVDELGRVDDLERVYAAGDMTAFPIKQGGIAAQQAVAAAHTIAVQAGAPVELEPFRAVLRGLLLTGLVPRFFRTDLTAWPSGGFQVDTNPLWWPPAKIAGRHLGPFLARHAGFEDRSGPPPDGIPVEIDLSARIP